MVARTTERGDDPCTVGECDSGEWVRLETGWWRLCGQLAGGVGARPRRGDGLWLEDLGQNWPAVLSTDHPVLERRRSQRQAQKRSAA